MDVLLAQFSNSAALSIADTHAEYLGHSSRFGDPSALETATACFPTTQGGPVARCSSMKQRWRQWQGPGRGPDRLTCQSH